MCLTFEGGIQIMSGPVQWYASSEWAERGSCLGCGSALFYKMREDANPQSVSAGSLDKAPGLAISEHIFIEEKPAYYDFADSAPRITGAEVVARFQPPGEPS